MGTESVGQVNQGSQSVLNGLGEIGSFYPQNGFGVTPKQGATLEGSKIILDKLETPHARGLGQGVSILQGGMDTVEALGALRDDLNSGDRLLTGFTKKVTAKVTESFIYAGIGGVALVASSGFAALSGVAVAAAGSAAYLVANGLDYSGLAPGLVGDISRATSQLASEFIDAVSPTALRKLFSNW